MALSASLVWEVRSSGLDANGGAFRAGSTGVDYSQQDAAQVVYSDLVIDSLDPSRVSSGTSPFAAAHLGNVLNVAGGVGFTTGRYEVVAVTGGVATLDRACGGSGATGGSGRLGGSLATLGALAAGMVASNKAFVRGGAYTGAATATFTGATSAPIAGGYYAQVIGYGTTRGDGGRPVLTISGSSITGLSFASQGWMLANFEVNGNGQSGSVGVHYNAGGPFAIYNVKVSNTASNGIRLNSSTHITAQRCEVTGCGSGAAAAVRVDSANVTLENFYVHDNACPGIFLTTHAIVLDSVIANNTGASSDGIYIGTTAWQILRNNTIHGNGRDGIRRDTTAGAQIGTIKNNLITSNGGFGIRYTTSSAVPAQPYFDGNAFWGNAAGARGNMDSTSGIDGFGVYTNVDDLTLTGNPYTNSAGGDFSLNQTAGAGAACRGAGVPDDWSGLTPTSSPDFGAIQATATAVGGLIRHPGMMGGLAG